jgi:hypothetical protein
MMSEVLVQLIFGWPAILLSLLISIIGLLWGKPRLLVLAGALAVPFSWYLSGYPAIRTPAVLLPVFQFGAGWALRSEKKVLAWVLLAPPAIIIAFLAVVVLTQ